MSLRLSFPATALDGRVHREEELTLARTASLQQQQQQHQQHQHAASPNPPAAEPSDDAVVPAAMDPSPAVPLNPNRRRVALPDPVALK